MKAKFRYRSNISNYIVTEAAEEQEEEKETSSSIRERDKEREGEGEDQHHHKHQKQQQQVFLAMAASSRDRELLIPVSETLDSDSVPKSCPTSHATPTSHSHHSGREAFSKVIRSWASKKFVSGCVILLPIAITFYITWWFIHFVDGFFSPIFTHLGINVFGLGFVTSITFIFLVGVFMSSWLGASVLGLGEWLIKKMPLVRHIYAASKQISAAISPDQSSRAFKELAIIRHPRIGEYAFGFITSSVILQMHAGDEELCCVYVPTNHLYLGDIFLINSKDIIRPNLSVREGIEIVISGGTAIPQVLSAVEARNHSDDHSRVFIGPKLVGPIE